MTERAQTMLRHVISQMIALVLLGQPGSAIDAPPSTSSLPIILQFNSSTHHLFWCGNRITSPALCTARNDTLLIDGFGPQPPDTSGHEFILSGLFAKVPIVTRLHEAGFSFQDAGNMYRDSMIHAASKAQRLYAQNKDKPAEERMARIRAGLDGQLVDLTKPIEVNAGSIAMSFRGWKREIFPVVDGRVPLPASARRKQAIPSAALLERVHRLQKLLLRDGGVLIIANEGGTLTLTGNQVPLGLAVIAEALRSPRLSMKERQKTASRVIPANMIREIVLAAEGGKE